MRAQKDKISRRLQEADYRSHVISSWGLGWFELLVNNHTGVEDDTEKLEVSPSSMLDFRS